MSSDLDTSICCRECQQSGVGVSGAYNFECIDCRVRYAIDFIRRMSGDDAKKTLDALAKRLIEEA